jgi:hypothetical protein
MITDYTISVLIVYRGLDQGLKWAGAQPQQLLLDINNFGFVGCVLSLGTSKNEMCVVYLNITIYIKSVCCQALFPVYFLGRNSHDPLHFIEVREQPIE